LLERRNLEVQAPHRPLHGRERVVVLHEVGVDSGLGEPPCVEHFGEEATLVATPLRHHEQDVGYFLRLDLHGAAVSLLFPCRRPPVRRRPSRDRSSAASPPPQSLPRPAYHEARRGARDYSA